MLGNLTPTEEIAEHVGRRVIKDSDSRWYQSLRNKGGVTSFP